MGEQILLLLQTSSAKQLICKVTTIHDTEGDTRFILHAIDAVQQACKTAIIYSRETDVTVTNAPFRKITK